MVTGSGSICLAQWEVQNSFRQIGALESLDDARAFGVVFGDIFKEAQSPNFGWCGSNFGIIFGW